MKSLKEFIYESQLKTSCSLEDCDWKTLFNTLFFSGRSRSSLDKNEFEKEVKKFDFKYSKDNKSCDVEYLWKLYQCAVNRNPKECPGYKPMGREDYKYWHCKWKYNEEDYRLTISGYPDNSIYIKCDDSFLGYLNKECF